MPLKVIRESIIRLPRGFQNLKVFFLNDFGWAPQARNLFKKLRKISKKSMGRAFALMGAPGRSWRGHWVVMDAHGCSHGRSWPLKGAP